MEHAEHAGNPALTVAIALAAGLIAQAVAHHLRIPGIVLLLVTGALLGPDVLNIVQPNTLGEALHALVGFAVAVVLFEGGLNLNVSRLRRESGVIQRLITVGALITAGGAAVAARYVLEWDWRPSILFGTLVIVTGPTVINPLVRRIRIKKSLQTVLEGEGVLIDAVGAISAVVALEIALRPSLPSFAMGLVGIVASLAIGSALGFVGGFIISFALRLRRWIPDGLENVFTLSMVLALFHIANAIQAEAGIAAVTIAGIIVGNTRTRLLRDLMEFKEQLTVMMIGLLFVILAADVRFADVQALGTRALLAVAVLMFVVRPLNILACTWRSGFTAKEKAFLCWMAPRGIVAAAIASFFAGEMEKFGIEGGATLRAMVFLVIAVTVTVQGLTGGPFAKLLGVTRPANRGYAILGANHLGRAVGRTLRDAGEEVVFLDSNADASHAAESDGFRMVFGNGLEESTMLRAGIEGFAGCLGLTENEEVNLLFAQKAREEFKVQHASAALQVHQGHITASMAHHANVHVLFGAERDIKLWESCMRRGFGRVEKWVYARNEETPADKPYFAQKLIGVLLPMTFHRGARVAPVIETTRFKRGDRVTYLVFEPKRDESSAWLTEQGWEPVATADPEPEADEAPAPV